MQQSPLWNFHGTVEHSLLPQDRQAPVTSTGTSTATHSQRTTDRQPHTGLLTTCLFHWTRKPVCNMSEDCLLSPKDNRFHVVKPAARLNQRLSTKGLLPELLPTGDSPDIRIGPLQRTCLFCRPPPSMILDLLTKQKIMKS